MIQILMNASQVEHMTLPRAHMQDESKCEVNFGRTETKKKRLLFNKGERYMHQKMHQK